MATAATTISERLRDPGHGVIVSFPTKKVTANGQTVLTREAYFFRVTATNPLYYEWDQLGALGSGNDSDFNYLGSTGHGAGDDVLRIANDDFHLLHFGYATDHPDLRVYESVDPTSDGASALDRTSFDGSDPTVPSQFDYVSSRRVGDRYDPPQFTERVAFRNDKDGEFTQFGFYADSALGASDTNLHLTGAGYKTAPITSADTQDAMLDAVVRQPAEPEIPTVHLEVGSLQEISLGTHLPDKWNDNHARTLTYGV